MTQIKGTLIPIGGNEDKKSKEDNGLDFVSEGILAHVVKESGGPESKIIVLPTASSIPRIVGKNYLKAFDELGCKDVEVIYLNKRTQSEDKKILKKIQKADCVMFSGGDQSKIAAKIGGTSLHKLLLERLQNDDFVIAGTSAGAMAMAQEMIAGGSNTEALLKGAVLMDKGLGFMPFLIIDTHFMSRGRFGRLAEAVAIHPEILGIGLAENTGLVIKNCNEFKVIGSGMVIVMDASNLMHNAHSMLKIGTAMSMSNLITHILANGDKFTLNDRKITILPIAESFV